MTEETRPNIPFICKYSGLLIGNFYPNTGLYGKTTVDGMSPYLRNWKEVLMLHPIFSVSIGALIIRAREQYILQKKGRATYPMQQKQLMMLALLHSSEAIVQDRPGLPDARIADTYLAEVLEFVDWKFSTGSSRLHLPKLHVGRDSGFEQVPAWIKACESVRDEYENTVRYNQQRAKKKAAEMALRNIRKNLYEDISLRRLWNWMEVQIPTNELADWPEIKDLFFVAEKNIGIWTVSEIDTLEEIFLEFCEVGNSISYEVSKRIGEIRNWLTIYEDTFEIRVTDQFPELRNTPAPKLADFQNKTAFLIAEAKWKLANKVQETVLPEVKPSRKSKITDEDL